MEEIDELHDEVSLIDELSSEKSAKQSIWFAEDQSDFYAAVEKARS